MSLGYDCDYEQGLCVPFQGRGATFKTPESCTTSCSKYCHLPTVITDESNRRTVIPGTPCKKQLVEYFDARRSPGCPANMQECRTQFQPVTAERHAGMSHRMSHGMNYGMDFEESTVKFRNDSSRNCTVYQNGKAFPVAPSKQVQINSFERKCDEYGSNCRPCYGDLYVECEGIPSKFKKSWNTPIDVDVPEDGDSDFDQVSYLSTPLCTTGKNYNTNYFPPGSELWSEIPMSENFKTTCLSAWDTNLGGYRILQDCDVSKIRESTLKTGYGTPQFYIETPDGKIRELRCGVEGLKYGSGCVYPGPVGDSRCGDAKSQNPCFTS